MGAVQRIALGRQIFRLLSSHREVSCLKNRMKGQWWEKKQERQGKTGLLGHEGSADLKRSGNFHAYLKGS